MSLSSSGAVIHRNVALIACDTAGTLQETLKKLGDLDVNAVAIGERHVILPASRAASVLERLKEHGQFPRLVGSQFLESPAEPAGEPDEPDEGEDV
ncbi:MAG: hypothetical protein ACJAYU_001810 [Bradymonadia bacterium]